MIGLLARVRRRAAAARGGDGGGDGGFVLVYVLAIIAIVTVLVTSTLIVVSGSVVPSIQSAYAQAATQAAQGGLQSFVAYADGNCTGQNSIVANCTLPSTDSGNTTIVNTNGYSATFRWTAQKDPSNRYFRVKSTGTVSQGSVTTSRTLIGDVSGGASMNVLDYGIVTGLETQSSASVLAHWQGRTIALDPNAVNAADVPVSGSSIQWNGAAAGAVNGSANVCDQSFDGRAAAPPRGAPNPYVNWSESSTGANSYTHYAPCQTSWGTQTKLLAPASPGGQGLFSNDALLISNSYPGGTGPSFNYPMSSTWHYTTADAGVCGAAPGQNYISFSLACAGFPVDVGGKPSGAYPAVTWVAQGPTLPTGAPVISNGVTCTYAGPTRVKLNGNTATITSPQTNSAWVSANGGAYPAQCYAGVTGSGLTAQSVNLSSPVSIAIIRTVNNGTAPAMAQAPGTGSTGWPLTGQKLGTAASTSNSPFYLSNGVAPPPSTVTTVGAAGATPAYVPATGSNPSTANDGAWDPQWTSFSTGNSCSTSTGINDLKWFNCYYGGNNNSSSGYKANAYSLLKSSIQGAIGASPQNYTTVGALQALVSNLVTPGNSSDAGATSPSNASNASHRWQSSTTQGNGGGCTQSGPTAGTSTTTAIPALGASDAFFASTAGSSVVTPTTTVSCFTSTVTAQIGKCGIWAIWCVSNSWTDGTLLGGPSSWAPQFAVTFTVTQTTTNTAVTASVSSFPSMSDVTQYQMGSGGTFGSNGPGDLYVEGTAAHTMALLATDDAIVTGNLGVSSPSSALQLIGQNNVRVYHPVRCTVTDGGQIATTTPGWCPNDITGLYSSVPPAGYFPYQQYVNMRGDLANLTIGSTAVFALGNYPNLNCAKLGGGRCAGDFTVDNYGRGDPLGQISVVGTLAMMHHGPVGQEWQIADKSPQPCNAASPAYCRPYSGYQLTQQYLNLKSLFAATPAVANILQTTTVSSSLWTIISISSAKAGS